MNAWTIHAAYGVGAYLLVALVLFWVMVCYEHVGRSGFGSMLSKPRSDVVALALLAIGWLPLLALSLMARRPRS